VRTAWAAPQQLLRWSDRASAGYLPNSRWLQPERYDAGRASAQSFARLAHASGLVEHLCPIRTRRATTDELERVHDAAYVNGVLEANPARFSVATLAAGLAIGAAEGVLAGSYANAFILTRPAGHHAGVAAAEGGCVFNNAALAAAASLADPRIGRVAIIDLDAHHGNGTQEIFRHSGEVLTISIHHSRPIPGWDGLASSQGSGLGTGCNLNVPLHSGAGPPTYYATFERAVVPALLSFDPDLLVVACGFDANTLDPLARMMLHSEAFRRLTQAILDAADRCCAGRAVFCYEGGYSAAYVPFCGLAVLETLAGRPTPVRDPYLTSWEHFSGDRLRVEDVEVLDDLTREHPLLA
jgi:acetoin utilization deacetylase AcuC-like enzyme